MAVSPCWHYRNTDKLFIQIDNIYMQINWIYIICSKVEHTSIWHAPFVLLTAFAP